VSFRLLADENVATGTETELNDRGHDAVHVTSAAELGAGTSDADLVAFVRRTDRVLITGDTGFLDPDHRGDATVLFCRDDDLTPTEIGELVDRLDAYVDDQFDLPSVYHLRRTELN